MEENKYKEALERAKSAIKECGDNVGRIKMIESIFPDELGGSEDERIRKDLISHLKHECLVKKNVSDVEYDKWIAWLEKQSKKPQRMVSAEAKEAFYGMKTPLDKAVEEEVNAWLEKQVSPDMVAEAYLRGCNDTEKKWIEKQGEQSNNEDVEKEKNDYVSGQFLYCKGSFNEFKEGESYWLEYVGNDNYIGRSDNILNQKFHITPRQLYTWLDPRHAYNCNETNAPTEQGEKDSSVKPPTFTFDDVLALQCCMETVKKVQEDKDLYEKLKDIHGRVYDAYQLEKQDEQKPIDKVEPKFKVGDWVVQGNRVYKVVEICESWYEVIDGEDNHFSISFDNEHMCRLWEISKDAKDGDVLYSPCCKLLWIYKDGNSCYIGNNLNYNENCVVVNSPICIPTDVVPATKEQRDILFQKMHKAGYEWDAEKKELKLLISNGGDFEPELSHQEATEKSEQDGKWKWEEDDEKFFKENILIELGNIDGVSPELYSKIIDWLNLIKKRLS